MKKILFNRDKIWAQLSCSLLYLVFKINDSARKKYVWTAGSMALWCMFPSCSVAMICSTAECLWEGGSGQGVRSVGLLYWQRPETVKRGSIYLSLPTTGMKQQGTTGSRTQPRWVSAEPRHTHICAHRGICAHSHPRAHTVLALKYTMSKPAHIHAEYTNILTRIDLT